MKGKKGVTLIEVMVVVAIVGILAAVAIPAYDNYITRSRRSAAFTALETVRAAQEMYRAEKGGYRNGNDFAANLLPGCSSIMGGDNYTITVTPPTGNNLTAFNAIATAQGKQVGDKYRQFQTNQDGQLSYYDSTWHTVTGKSWEDLR